jgi:CheY-like chemotaxis protein
MRVIILDDDKKRHDFFDTQHVAAIHVQTYRELRLALLYQSDPFDLIRLDHDLEDLREDGLMAAKYIAALPINLRPKQVIIHSTNKAGREQMKAVLDASNIPTTIEPFDTLK